MPPPMSKEAEQELSDLYYNTFFGRDKLYELAKKNGIQVSWRQVAQFLKEQKVHQLYSRKFKRREVKATVLSEPFKQIGLDLVDMSNLEIRGFKWLLVAVDLFSKKVWARALKDKKAGLNADVVKAFKSILDEMKQTPTTVRSDRGSEFISKAFQDLLKQNNIKQILSQPGKPWSNGQVEKMNQTLKRIIKKYRFVDNKDWVKLLPDILENINNVPNDTTGISPNDIIADKSLWEQVNENITGKVKKFTNTDVPKFEVGDIVRVQMPSGSDTNYSREVFKVEEVFKPKAVSSFAPSYFISDMRGKLVSEKGVIKRFYNEDLLKIPDIEEEDDHDNKFTISRIVRPTVRNNVPSYEIRWKNYTAKDNTIEPRDNLLEDIPKKLRAYERSNKIEWYQTDKGQWRFRRSLPSM